MQQVSLESSVRVKMGVGNGPEFASRAVKSWLATRQVGPLFVEPGSPWENGYVESFNPGFPG